MNKYFLAIVMAVSVSIFAVGCSDKGGGSGGENPNPSEGAGTLVNRADLLVALWTDEAADTSKSELSNADCLAESSFVIRNAVGFAVRRNANISDMNVSPSVVVSPVNIEISDTPGVSRGAGCPSGDIFYVVTAGEEMPLDIEASDSAAATKPVDESSATATPYAEGCDLIAHFEKQSASLCVEPEQGPAEEAEDEDVEDAAALESDEEVVADGSSEETIEEEPAQEPEAEGVEEEGCGEIQTFKLVIDSVVCQDAAAVL